MNTIIKSLNKYYKNNEYIKISRKINDFNIFGYLLAISDNFILIQIIEDFHTDGYQLIRTKDIDQVFCNEYQKYTKTILRKEGIENNIGIKYDINIDSWQKIFHSLNKNFKIIIVEGEEETVDEFLIGIIEEINEQNIKMSCFKPNGKWTKTKFTAPYEQITSVKFDNEYINIWEKYIL